MGNVKILTAFQRFLHVLTVLCSRSDLRKSDAIAIMVAATAISENEALELDKWCNEECNSLTVAVEEFACFVIDGFDELAAPEWINVVRW